MATIGKVYQIAKVIEWSIDEFFPLPEVAGKEYKSPSFLFAGESWYLKILPNGSPENNSVGYVDLYLFRKLADPPVALTWSFGLKTAKGEKDLERKGTNVFQKKDEGWGTKKLWKRSALSKEMSQKRCLEGCFQKRCLVPSDNLTIVCTLQYYSGAPDNAEGTASLISSLKQAQKTISDITHDNDVLREKLTTLENEFLSEKEAKENAQAKLGLIENTIESLEMKIKEESDNALALQQQHESVLKDLEIKHQNEILKCKEDFDKLQATLTAKITESDNLSSELSHLQKKCEELQLEKRGTSDRLAKKLEASLTDYQKLLDSVLLYIHIYIFFVSVMIIYFYIV